MTRIFLIAGFLFLIVDGARRADPLGSAWLSSWMERAQRLPTPVWSSPSRASLALVGGAVTNHAGRAQILQRFEVATRSPVTAVAEGNGGVVFGTFDEGLFRIAPGSSAALHQPLEIDPRVNDLVFDETGSLFVATQAGAFRVAADGTTAKLASGAFTAAAIWRGQPWFASRRGLSTLDRGGFRTLGKEQGIVADSPAALAACGEMLCVGALDGLWLFDGRSAVHRSSAAGDLPADWVTAAAWNNGEIWAATFDAGLSRLGASGIRLFGAGDGLPESRTEPRALVVDGATVFAGTPNGLLALRGDTVSLIRDGLPESDVTAVARASQGQLWVGYRGGVSRIAVEAMP